MPADDASWPRCNEHSTSEIVRHWCDWTRQYLLDGLDINELTPGMPFSVPVAPFYEMYATCNFGEEIVAGSIYKLLVVIEHGSGLNSWDEYELGLWNRGEGRMIIATVLRDWALGRAENTCTAREHKFVQELQLKKLQESQSAIFETANNWSMAVDKCCLACAETRKAEATGTPIASWDASSYGVQPSEFKRPVVNDRADRTRSALQNRFAP